MPLGAAIALIGTENLHRHSAGSPVKYQSQWLSDQMKLDSVLVYSRDIICLLRDTVVCIDRMDVPHKIELSLGRHNSISAVVAIVVWIKLCACSDGI